MGAQMDVRKVLIVDDDDAVRRVTQEMLERESYDVTCAGGGEQALSYLEGIEFDAVLLDVSMPGMSGTEVFSEIRLKLPLQPVVFMTGYAEQDIAQLSDEKTTYLSKPFSSLQLGEAISSII